MKFRKLLFTSFAWMVMFAASIAAAALILTGTGLLARLAYELLRRGWSTIG